MLRANNTAPFGYTQILFDPTSRLKPGFVLPEPIAKRMSSPPATETPEQPKAELPVTELFKVTNEPKACDHRVPIHRERERDAPSTHYFIEPHRLGQRTALVAWIQTVFKYHTSDCSPKQALSILNTFFHNRNLIRKDHFLTQKKSLKELMALAMPIIQSIENLTTKNLSRTLGGVGLVPRSFLPDGVEDFLIKQILSHSAQELSELGHKYLARMIFGLQNFEINSDLEVVLKLVAEALKLKTEVANLEDATLLSRGIQRFHKICPPQLLKTIEDALNANTTNTDTETIEECAHIISNLRGFSCTTEPLKNILGKAIKTIEQVHNLPLTTALETLIGLAANADKVKSAQGVFYSLLRHTTKLIKDLDPIIRSTNAREVIFACKLYQSKIKQSERLEKIIASMKEFVMPRKAIDSKTLNDIKDTVEKVFEPSSVDLNVHLLDESVEADILVGGKLNIEVDGPQHELAAHRVRDKLREGLLKNIGIIVERIPIGSLEEWKNQGSLYKELKRIKDSVAGTAA